MKLLSLHNCLSTTLIALTICSQAVRADSYPRSIFVPRQLAYNPIYEDALVFDTYAHMEERFLFSVKPIYTQTVGNQIKRYFNIDHDCSMKVEEDGSGDIDSLWFQVISAPDSFYSSRLSFSPVEKTFGGLLYLAFMLPDDWAITLNTAFVGRKNNMHICESGLIASDLGQEPGFATITQALSNPEMHFGRVCGTQTKGGVDDIQLKVLKNFRTCNDTMFWDVYSLIGIPTGKGSKAKYLFEPLVGSKHAQLGLGANAEKSFEFNNNKRISLYGDLKWRYAFQASECRSFDMIPNGQWSRYMLFTTPTSDNDPFFAINDLTFKAKVTPRNSVDLLLAMHAQIKGFSFEAGYDFWYRQAEKVCPCIRLPEVGIADLVGIAKLNSNDPVPVTTASQATISEGVYPNEYQMPHDTSYTLVTSKNINSCSGAQPSNMTNGFFGSLNYTYDRFDFGINASYEHASNCNTASVVSGWINFDVRF